jgi:hypothetical protein
MSYWDLQINKIQLRSAGANFVLYKQLDQLLSIHQAYRRGVRTIRFLSRAIVEIARCDDQALFVRSQTSPNLLELWGIVR